MTDSGGAYRPGLARPDDGSAWDRRVHPCGCVTVFDLGRWASVTLSACNDHLEAVLRRASA